MTMLLMLMYSEKTKRVGCLYMNKKLVFISVKLLRHGMFPLAYYGRLNMNNSACPTSHWRSVYMYIRLEYLLGVLAVAARPTFDSYQTLLGPVG